jgi:hypothetical protein
VIGGTGRIPGFRRRLLNEIQRLVDTEPQYAAFKALADQFCVVDPAFPPHYLSWLGGSFMGCVEHDQAITQAQYTEGKYKFPDWLRVADVKRYRTHAHAHNRTRAIAHAHGTRLTCAVCGGVAGR